MNKKIFLTSAVIMCMACPAFAETFPSDGNMLEDKTYANAAVYDNTGVYEGDVTANAYYSINNYNVSAGSYLSGLNNDNTATTAQCTSGNYCPGVQSTTYDDVNSAFVNTGLQACPQNYSGSAAGATANTDCYRTCSTTDVAKSATVSGQMYYDGTSGDGVNACVPETCVSGWHVKAAVPDLNAIIGTTSYSSWGYIDNGGVKQQDAEALGLTANNTYAVAYNDNKGTIYGQARCSTQQGSKGNLANDSYPYITKFASLTDETGQDGAFYCYCNVTGYTPAGGTLQSVPSHWVFKAAWSGSVEGCSGSCARECSIGWISSNTDNRRWLKTFLGMIQSSPASCEANTINITWNDADAADIAATGAATTVYEGDIKTPLKAITKPGKTFVGWKFIKQQQ